MGTSSSIVGRYAPSPTGDLHLGNLRTALVAWLHARIHGGEFLLRMEDVDTPRVVPGSDSQILKDLEWLGLDWDGEVMYQSDRTSRYREVLSELGSQGLTYPCFCSRKDIQLAGSAPHGVPGVYPGTCSTLDNAQISERMAHKNPATRLRVSKSLRDDCGDFVVHRADGLFAYQLAVVVDDLDQGVTDVVRGHDLASSTSRQEYLAEKLVRRPNSIRYHHVSLMLDQDGKRMSKRDGSFSAREWQATGKSAESLVAQLASSLGLVSSITSISVIELRELVSLAMLADVFDESK